MSDKQWAIGIINLLLRIILLREALIGQNVNARMHTMSFTLSGSPPSLALSELRTKKERMVKILASRLSIENDRLKVGQVKRVTSNNGNKIDSISLLLNESVEVLFAPNGNTLEFTVSNPNIDMSNLDCTIDKETLRDLVISFKDAYNQIIANESEGTNS